MQRWKEKMEFLEKKEENKQKWREEVLELLKK